MTLLSWLQAAELGEGEQNHYQLIVKTSQIHTKIWARPKQAFSPHLQEKFSGNPQHSCLGSHCPQLS